MALLLFFLPAVKLPLLEINIQDEFRDLVQAFHDKGIAVIIDIVPNHTGENMDGGEQYFNFNGIDKLQKNLSNLI